MHLASCARCQRRAEDLRAVRGLLGALPQPEVPPDVFAGIAARLTRAQRPPRARTRVGIFLGGWARGLEPRHLGLVAVAALIGGVASVILHGNHGAGTAPINAALASRRTPSPATTSASASAHQRAVVAIVMSSAPLVVARGRDYHHATLTDGAGDLLASASYPAAPSPLEAAQSAAVRDVLPTAGCLRALGARMSGTPATSLVVVAVEAAQYDTQPATVLVLIDPARQGRGVVLALANRCVTDAPLVLDQEALAP